MLRLFPGLVRIPDVAHAPWNRFPKRPGPNEAAPSIIPDLVVDILSKSNTKREMNREREEYFASGVLLVWEIDPPKRTVAVYIDPASHRVLGESDTLDGGDVLPGFTLKRSELFSELDRTPPAGV